MKFAASMAVLSDSLEIGNKSSIERAVKRFEDSSSETGLLSEKKEVD